ncbi:hypothetical protein [Agrobacterium vitis]|uniref:hypothetical protein n=1 Tax=Agrobacterium vitis TaxID=373 RepID=UPI0018D22B88|nr:hypothetical protein [Agrobacterium vitis]
MKITERAIDKLANAMRIYAEANARFDELKKVDLQEAIDNLDRAFEAKLEAFHSLYDVDKVAFDYFENADTAVILLLRNAIHHRDHDMFSSWNATMAQEGGPLRFLGAEFLIASHHVAGGGHVGNQLYKVEDFLLRVDSGLNSPALETKMSAKNRVKTLGQLRTELRFNELLAKASDSVPGCGVAPGVAVPSGQSREWISLRLAG